MTVGGRFGGCPNFLGIYISVTRALHFSFYVVKKLECHRLSTQTRRFHKSIWLSCLQGHFNYKAWDNGARAGKRKHVSTQKKVVCLQPKLRNYYLCIAWGTGNKAKSSIKNLRGPSPTTAHVFEGETQPYFTAAARVRAMN